MLSFCDGLIVMLLLMLQHKVRHDPFARAVIWVCVAIILWRTVIFECLAGMAGCCDARWRQGVGAAKRICDRGQGPGECARWVEQQQAQEGAQEPRDKVSRER
jgi:hypothetical protein